MNLGKFNDVIWQINSYFEENELVKLYELMMNSLQSQIASSTIDNVNIFRSQIDLFYEAARSIPSYAHMGSFRDVVNETKGQDFFGAGLEDYVNEIIHKQFVSALEMQSELQAFHKKFIAYVANIKTLATSLNSLTVEYDSFAEDEYEFSALLPKDLVGHTIENIHSELLHLDRLFKSLNELMGKGNTSPNVKTISSSWWQFFLDLDHTQIAAVTFALERIVNLYKSSLEIRKLKSDAEKLELNQEIINGIEIQVEAKVKEGMKAIAKELRQTYENNDDKSRCNELEIQIRQELIVIAKRLNQGALYEVKAGLPDKPEEPEPEADGKVDAKKQEEYAALFEKYNQKLQSAQKINYVNELIIEVSDGMIENQNMLLLDYESIKD